MQEEAWSRREKGYTSLYNGIDRADEKLMKLLPLKWNEGREEVLPGAMT